MSARAIPTHLEAEVIAKHHEGLSLRAISAWLLDTQHVLASREAVSGVLNRSGILPEELITSDVTRQLGEHADVLTAQFFTCLSHYPRIIEESQKLDPKARVSAALQAANAWAKHLTFSLRAIGVLRPSRARTPAEPPMPQLPTEVDNLQLLAQIAANLPNLPAPPPAAQLPQLPAHVAPPPRSIAQLPAHAAPPPAPTVTQPAPLAQPPAPATPPPAPAAPPAAPTAQQPAPMTPPAPIIQPEPITPPPAPTVTPSAPIPHRNSACPCRSGKKWKKCCGVSPRAVKQPPTSSIGPAGLSG